MADDSNKQHSKQSELNSSKRMASEAISLGFSVVIFVLIGVGLDSLFKTAPLFILLGVFFALASMVYFMWRLINAPRSR